MDEASALVRTLCCTRVSRVLLVYSMRQCFNMAVLHGHGTRQAPWYVPCAAPVCLHKARTKALASSMPVPELAY